MANVTKKVASNRAQEAVNVASPGRVQQARKADPHGHHKPRLAKTTRKHLAETTTVTERDRGTAASSP